MKRYPSLVSSSERQTAISDTVTALKKIKNPLAVLWLRNVAQAYIRIEKMDARNARERARRAPRRKVK